MIAVEMRGQQEIDLRQSRLFCDSGDALCVTIVGRLITRIDEERLACRRDEQRCRAAFGINLIDIEIARLGEQNRGASRRDQKEKYE